MTVKIQVRIIFFRERGGRGGGVVEGGSQSIPCRSRKNHHFFTKHVRNARKVLMFHENVLAFNKKPIG